MRLGMVVQRYGEGVDGGAEAHCRALAERLARRHQVTVLTSCAQDYLSWANHFPAGKSALDGVGLWRFPVKRPRRIRWFNYLAQRIYQKPHSLDAEWRWLVRQGPYLPGLLEHLLGHSDLYDALIFFTYLYFPTAAGLPLAPHKSILIPTAHDEPPLYLALFRALFHLPRCIFFNSSAERDLVHRVMGNQSVPHQVVGLGIDPPSSGDPEGFKARHGLEGRFLLYLGRVDVFKGCREMLAQFQRLTQEPGLEKLQLVLAGSKRMDIPSHPGIKALGYVSQADRDSALAACTALIMPSPHESLSMVTLEAGLAGKPVLVNARCQVLAEYAAQSEAGLTYRDYEGLREGVRTLLQDPAKARIMGEKGRNFVSRRFDWERVLEAYEQVLSQVAAGAGPGPARPPWLG
ncbi:MAG: glycosyltransferase family 4 protein [Desulfarculaceae bacterium]|jgi:glycosyltransferase involved in cell wall biosynthesis